MTDQDARVDATIAKLVASKSASESDGIYAEWESYDDDLDRLGYVAPLTCTRLLVESGIDKHASVLDAGCGTGKVGALLAAEGFNTLHGIDYSASMLERAQKQGHYVSLATADFSDRSTLPRRRFGGIVCVGVFNDSFGNQFLAGLVDILEPGASLVFSARPQFEECAREQISRLLDDTLIDSESWQLSDYIREHKSEAWYVSVRRRID